MVLETEKLTWKNKYNIENKKNILECCGILLQLKEFLVDYSTSKLQLELEEAFKLKTTSTPVCEMG